MGGAGHVASVAGLNNAGMDCGAGALAGYKSNRSSCGRPDSSSGIDSQQPPFPPASAMPSGMPASTVAASFRPSCFSCGPHQLNGPHTSARLGSGAVCRQHEAADSLPQCNEKHGQLPASSQPAPAHPASPPGRQPALPPTTSPSQAARAAHHNAACPTSPANPALLQYTHPHLVGCQGYA